MKHFFYFLTYLLLPLTLSAQITTFPYIEDFDNDDGGWTTSGTNNSWEWGLPNNVLIVENETCGGNAWVTNLDGDYSNSELSYLESPVFDLSGFTNDPVVRFNLTAYTEFQFDGVYLDVSTDGTTWNKVLGGFNWYNDTDNNQWGGNRDWSTSTKTLTGLAGEGTVSFRFVFESDATEVAEGAGVDLFILSEGSLDDFLVFVDSPESGCDFSDTQTITAELYNDTSFPVSNFQICFELNANPPECETFTGTIAVGNFDSYSFTATGDFSAYGSHSLTITADVSDAITCNNESSVSIQNIETISTFPHYQNFEAGNANWESMGFNNSWAFGTPNKTVIQGASSGVNAWTTGGLGTDTYNQGEFSEVLSPCFDFSSLPSDYYVGADIWWNSESFDSGALLQATTDNGQNWLTIGNLGDPVNWYNDSYFSFQISTEVWTGTGSNGSGGWTLAYHTIPASLIGESSVRFRFLFQADNLFEQEVALFDGFAFDNFFIGTRPVIEVDYCSNPIVLDVGSGYETYAWSTTAMTQTIEATPGNYTVTVTDVNDITTTFSIEVSNIPLPTISINQETLNCGTANLTAISNVSTYKWSTGVSTQSIFAGTTGTYTVTVMNSVGCTATEETTIETAVIPNPNISGQLVVCPNGSTILTANTNLGTYAWSNGQNTQTITATVGTYTVTVSNGNNCTASDSVEISESTLPIPTITGDLFICNGDESILDAGDGFNSYSWSTGASTQTTVVTTSGIYSVLVTSSLGCSNSEEVEVSAGSISPQFNNNTLNNSLEVCAGETGVVYRLTETYDVYKWNIVNGSATNNPTNGNSGNGKRRALVDWSDDAGLGEVYVSVTDASGCKGVLSVQVNIHPNPISTITGDLIVCPQESTILDAGDNFNSYSWSSGESTQTISAMAGLYTVTVSNDFDCTGTDAVEVSESTLPMPTITGELILCPRESTILDAGDNFNSYSWSNGESTQTISVMSGTYAVTVSNKNDCLGQDEFEVAERLPLTLLEGSEGFNPYMSPVGMEGFSFTVCGGQVPRSYSLEGEGGFIYSNTFPGDIAGCEEFVVYYVYKTEWSLTIEDICGDFTYTKDDVRLLYPQIDNFEITHENCIGDENGSLSVNVSGGDTSCGNYTYTWSGPAEFSASSQTITNLASGYYYITITDCEGDLTASKAFINRLGVAQNDNGSRSGRGRGRGRGCSGLGVSGNNKADANHLSGIDAGFLGLYPNPFENSTTIEFQLTETDQVWMSVFSSDGRKIEALLEGFEVKGNEKQSFLFDSDDWHSGIYLLQIRTSKGVFLYEKMVIR